MTTPAGDGIEELALPAIVDLPFAPRIGDISSVPAVAVSGAVGIWCVVIRVISGSTFCCCIWCIGCIICRYSHKDCMIIFLEKFSGISIEEVRKKGPKFRTPWYGDATAMNLLGASPTVVFLSRSKVPTPRTECTRASIKCVKSSTSPWSPYARIIISTGFSDSHAPIPNTTGHGAPRRTHLDEGICISI